MTWTSSSSLSEDGFSALVVSPDVSVVNQLRGVLESQHNCRIETADNYEVAGEILSRNGLKSVFVDLRVQTDRQDPVPFLEKLGRLNGHRIPVVAISDDGYAPDWALVADSTIGRHLRLPLDQAQISCLVEGLQAKAWLPEEAPRPRVFESQSIRFQTCAPEMSETLERLMQMAGHDVPLLLVGETGTGKTTIARLVHELSTRRHETFLTVACGALPPELIESELFGHIKGAFTSADRSKAGKFEVASQGSLLLDEIDILAPAQQAKLLRVIESGEFEPVGSNETKRTKARLIVASNVDLAALLESNHFRADLYYRLNMLEFRILPLRRRPHDIVPLTLGFIEEFCAEHGTQIHRIHPEFLALLKNYDWPGNIRELKNHIRRAVLYCRRGELSPLDLAPAILQGARSLTSQQAPASAATLSQRVALSEREILEQALLAHGNKRTATAKSLGISRVGLYKKMKKYAMLAPKGGSPSAPASPPKQESGDGNGPVRGRG